MALPVRSYVWPRVRHVVGLFVPRVTGLAATNVLWDDQNANSPALPYIGLKRRTYPLNGFDDEYIREVVTSVSVEVTASAEGESAGLLLFGLPYRYTLAAGEGATDARDKLLELIEPDLIRVVSNGTRSYGVGFQPVTAVASGPASIVFEGLSSGPAKVSAIEGASVTTLAASYRTISEGLRRFIVRVELYWPEDFAPFESADDYAEEIRSAVAQDEEQAEWLRQRGVGVEQGGRITIQDTSALSGGLRERRLFLDVIFNASAKRYKPDPATIEGAGFVVEAAV